MKAMPFEARRVFSVAAGLALVALLGACDGSTTGPNPPPPPPPITLPPPSVVSQGGGSLKAGFTAMVPPITTSVAGALDVTVDWTFATNDVDVLITRGSCSFPQLENNQCNIAAFSVSATAKPERMHVTGAAASVYTLFIENTGPADESVSYQVVLSPGASSASEGPSRSLELPDKWRHPRGVVSW